MLGDRFARALENLGPPGIRHIARTPSVRYILDDKMEAEMALSTGARDDRIELRATKEEKRLLVAAAAQERLDVTSFIMRRALPAAREVVANAERIVLSERDAARVLRLLEKPPKPTRALLEAARRRRSRR